MENPQNVDPGLSAYYRKATVAIKLVRFLVLLGFVVFAVFCIGFFKDNITMDNVRYLVKYMDLFSTDSTPSNAEIAITTEENSSFVMLGSDLAVVSNSGVGLYDFAGNKLYQYETAYANAAVESNGKNLLVYDTQGKKLSVYNAVSKVLDMELEYNIKAACINDLGYFAVINSEKTYRSGVIVFDRENGKELFRWMSPDKYLTGVTLNAAATTVVCTAVSNRNGVFCTELVAYDTRTGEKTVERTLEDTLALKIGYVQNDAALYVLTDSAFLCYDKELNLVGSAAYNPDNAKFFRVFDDCFLIAESNNLSGNSMTVRAYAYDASLLFECSTEERILDAAYVDGTLYLLESSRLAVYDYGTVEQVLTPLAEQPLGVQYRAVRADTYGRYILISAKNAKRNSLALLLEDFTAP